MEAYAAVTLLLESALLKSEPLKAALKKIGLALCLSYFSALFFVSSATACTVGACLSAGPRLASIDTAHSALLNGLLGSLLGSGSGLSLTALDWNAIAQSNINLSVFLNALQVQTSTASPAAALNANATIAQILNAAVTAATADSNTAAVSALGNAITKIGALGGSIKLGDLLNVSLPTGALATTKINLLELITGSIQLANYKNVATTPTPIGVSVSALGLSSTLTGVNLYAQVVEPPVYICGGTGVQFYSAAIRIKLNMTLLSLTPDTALLNSIAGLLGTSLTVGQLQIYLDVAKAQGTLNSINSLANAVVVQATPGVANLYLGSMTDSVFFTRTHAINVAADLGYATIANLTVTLPIVGATVVAVQAKSAALGTAPLSDFLTFTGPFPQTKTSGTSTSFIANLLSSLATNLQLQLTPSLGGILDAALLTPLKTIINGAITPVLTTLLTSLADPLLELLGVRIGEVDVSVNGTGLVCSLSGYGYNDANHSSSRDNGEIGCGSTLYAKLIPASTPSGPAVDAVAVDTSTGAYSFSNVYNGNYTVVIDNNATLSDITPTMPSGWLGTEAPTQIRTVAVVTDVSNQNFGFFNGSRISGNVFKDNGISGAIPNNGIQEASESGVAAVIVKAMNSADAVLYDSTPTTTNGAYTLWVPAAAGNNALHIIDVRPAATIAVSGNVGTTGGTFTRTTDTVNFTNTIGTSYSGVNFGLVPDNNFSNDNQQTILPGAIAYHPHAFIAGAAGQLTFASSGVATPTSAWGAIIYRDTNCNSVVDAGEVAITAAIAVVADQKICIVIKTTSPPDAVYNARYVQTVSASFVYTTAAFSGLQNRTDITTVGRAGDAGLSLVKTVDKATAKTGDVITYTIRYENKSSGDLQNLKIYDATPAFTVFGSALCGALPTGLTGCSLTKQPTAGNTGALEWTFVGALTSGSFGTVTFNVTLQ
ncbi:MAG: hypothetical protein JWM78_279 [Verrucomicrobiaceae bacterium]|nr:hypothetical protein [Verrucomicrobiaceae bacterium]